MTKQKLLGFIAGMLMRFMSKTWKIIMVYHDGLSPLPLTSEEIDESYIVAHWHGDELALLGHAGYAPFLTITSDSKDGTIMDTAIKVKGDYTSSRGSSTRGGVKAVIGLLKHLENRNYFISIAVDGPKGPLHQAKAGFYSIAKKKNLKVIQMIVECPKEDRWDIPNTWNKTFLPKPFARFKIHYYPMPSVNDLDQEQFLALYNQRTSAEIDEKPVIELDLCNHQRIEKN